MAYLLDTNVVSELARSRCNPNVRTWSDSIPPEDLYMSCLVIGELRKGIELVQRSNDHVRAAQIAEWFEGLKTRFASRIIPVDEDVAAVWGRMVGQYGPLAPIDSLMAATAYLRDWTFVTRNVKDVERTGVRTLNPWEPITRS
jgi:predicted nucleic acid-binding protein